MRDQQDEQSPYTDGSMTHPQLWASSCCRNTASATHADSRWLAVPSAMQLAATRPPACPAVSSWESGLWPLHLPSHLPLPAACTYRGSKSPRTHPDLGHTGVESPEHSISLTSGARAAQKPCVRQGMVRAPLLLCLSLPCTHTRAP